MEVNCSYKDDEDDFACMTCQASVPRCRKPDFHFAYRSGDTQYCYCYVDPKTLTLTLTLTLQTLQTVLVQAEENYFQIAVSFLSVFVPSWYALICIVKCGIFEIKVTIEKLQGQGLGKGAVPRPQHNEI